MGLSSQSSHFSSFCASSDSFCIVVVFFPLVFFLLFPLCFSKFLSLSCFLFLFFASRFPSPVCCYPWLSMPLQSFPVSFHLASAQPLPVHRSSAVVVEVSCRNLAPSVCLIAQRQTLLLQQTWAVPPRGVVLSSSSKPYAYLWGGCLLREAGDQLFSMWLCSRNILRGCHWKDVHNTEGSSQRASPGTSFPCKCHIHNLVFYMLHYSAVVVVYKTIWGCDLWEEGALQKQHRGFHRQQLFLGAVTIQINTLHLLCSFHCWHCQQFISGACSELLSGRQRMQLLVIRL